MTLRQRVRLVVVLGSLIAVGPLTIDMYLPALPALTDDLETTSTAVQLTLTGTLVGLALGQLVIGPLADAYGRRRPLLAGLALHVVASALCVVAPSIGVLGVLRVIQGLGVAATTVVAMAVVRDLFSGTAFARLFSRLMLVMGLAPILAPTVGSAVLEATNWRGVFVVLGAFGVLLTITALVALRETLPPSRRRVGGVVDTVRTYGSLLTDRVFVGMVLVAGFGMAAVFSYVAGSSFVFQDQYGLDERQFGIAFGAGAVGLIAATQLNVRLLRRHTPQRVLVVALAGGTAAGALLIAFAATGFGGLATLLAALWLVLFAGGLAMPNASAVAMTRHGEAAGTAAALLGAVQFGTGALAAPLVGVLGNDSVAMAVVVAGGMVAATSALLLVARPHRMPAEPVPVAA
ncbi:multidrug effflux MFS transporter [Asanoa iriomotensis]|nr:multidrug effflux MFS transporter [Asanoa iriomotensis]